MRRYTYVQAERHRADQFIDLSLAELKAPGEPAHLGYWDDGTHDVEVGDIIETSTGRRYLVTTARRTAGTDPHWELDTVVMDPEDPYPEGCTVHGLQWFPRSKRA